MVGGDGVRISGACDRVPVNWSVLVEHWAAWMRAAGAPETTVALRVYYVVRLARAHAGVDLLALDVDALAAWIAAGRWSPNTAKSARSALRSFYGWARETGRVAVSPAHLLPPVRVPRARPKPTPEQAYRAAVAAADPRARLAIRLAGVCGLRRGEIARVRGDDVEADLLGYSLRVVGKGGHVRMVPVPDDLAGELRQAAEAGGGWVFPSPAGGHLTPHHVAKIVTRWLPEGVTTHSLRHRCASSAYAGTRDLRAVQELLGHARPETTAGYVLAPEDSIRAAVNAAAA